MKQDADDHLPRPPKLTDKQLEENDARQKDLREAHERTPVPAHGSTYDRALAVIKDSEPIPLKDIVPIQRERYAQALADVGKFKEAAKVSQDAERKKYYRDIDKAVWLDDDKRCRCENHKTFDLDSNEIEHDRFFTVREVWSEKHGKVVDLIRCNLCKMMNTK